MSRRPATYFCHVRLRLLRFKIIFGLALAVRTFSTQLVFRQQLKSKTSYEEDGTLFIAPVVTADALYYSASVAFFCDSVTLVCMYNDETTTMTTTMMMIIIKCVF